MPVASGGMLYQPFISDFVSGALPETLACSSGGVRR